MNEQRNWWERRSAADDGADDMDRPSRRSRGQRERSWLDDFDFDRTRERDGRATVSRLWDRWGSGSYGSGWSAGRLGDDTAATLRLLSAKRVVQGFVDTFATGDGGYSVVFDPNVQTAGTNFTGRKVTVGPGPLFDKTLDADQANAILTAMATHESAHVRYGIDFFRAVEAKYQFTQRDISRSIANVLGDIHDEAAFTADYPGYEDVFNPGIEYVGRSFLRDGRKPSSDQLDPANLGLAAIRYPDAIDWQPSADGERAWWGDWADRGRAMTTVDEGLDLVAEALAHLQEQEQAQSEPEPGDEPQPQDPDGDEDADEDGDEDGESDGDEDADEDGDEDGESDGDEDGEDGEGSGDFDPSAETGDQPGQGGSLGGMIEVPDCWAEAAQDVAEQNGVTQQVDGTLAETLVQNGEALTEDGKGEVYWNAKSLSQGRRDVARNGSAVAAIRSAFARSRTGEHGVERRLRSGRLDNRSLPRIGESDYRLFHRKLAQSEGRYRVWLLLDHSTSMAGPESWGAAQVAAALAEATRALPNVALDIFTWTSGGYKVAGTLYNVVRVYADGAPVSDIGLAAGLRMGGTPDAAVLDWAGQAIQKHARPGEQPVIILASDGMGSLRREYDAGKDPVGDIRKTGVAVVSVAFGDLGGFQETAYGRGNYIPWGGSIQATARPLGKLIARIAAGRGART